MFGAVGDARSSHRRKRFSAANAAAAHCVTVLLKPGVMDPVAQSALAAAADLGVPLEAVATLRKYWFAGASEADVKNVERAAVGQRRDRAGRDRAAADGAARSRAGRIGSSCGRCRSASWMMMRSCGSAARGSSICSWPRCRRFGSYFRELGPRSDRRRAGNDRPNLERALQPQDARRPDRVPRRARRAAVRQHAQGDDLRRDAADSRASWATTTGA